MQVRALFGSAMQCMLPENAVDARLVTNPALWPVLDLAVHIIGAIVFVVAF